MLGGGVTAHTIEILAFDTHVDIQGFIGLDQRGIQVAVFHPVTAAAVKMAGPAIFTPGSTHILGCLAQLCLELSGNLQRIFIAGIQKSRNIFNAFIPVHFFAAVTDQTIEPVIRRSAPSRMTGQAALVFGFVG